MPNAFIIHGVGGTPQENWFPWLKSQLEQLGYQVFIPQFTTPEGQNLENWLATFKDYEKNINEESIIIGHSLGVPFAINLIEKHKFKSAFLVAGFVGSTGNIFEEGMKTFTHRDFDWEKINENCQKFYIFNSDNDPYVQPEKGQELKSKLKNSELITVKGAGHLNQSAGYTKFPLLLTKIKEAF
ncbi:MAG: alpha/beta hydrolase [Candidatus Gracilibacteria bacterium]|nr:alpha/beta hydrolase [Candidatus Gracilibacteria bacterium]